MTVKLNAQSNTVASSISSTTEGRRIALTLTGALLLPLGLLLAAFLSGGFRESTYSLLAAAVWLGLAVARWPRPSGPVLALLGLGGWTLLSALWGAPGPALRVAPLVLLYAGVVVAGELVDARLLLAGVWAACTAVVCAGLTARSAGAGFALASGEGSQRLDWPLEYANGLGLVAVACMLLAAEADRRKAALDRFVQHMKANRRKFFRSHHSRKARARFVKKQLRQLHALQRAVASCD